MVVKNKEKKQTKSKSVSKSKKSVKSKQRGKAAFGLTDMLPSQAKKGFQTDLSSFFAQVAIKQKKKKPSRTEIIKSYTIQKERIANYDSELEKQFAFRYSQQSFQQHTYSTWKNQQSNSKEYPENRKAFWDNWDSTKRVEKPLDSKDGGDGRIKKVRESAKSRYEYAKEQIPKMEDRYVYLPIDVEVKEVKGLTTKQIQNQTEIGVTGYLAKDSSGNDIEITHVFNYQPSAIPVYHNKDLIELAKSDEYGNVTLRKSSGQAYFTYVAYGESKEQIDNIGVRNGFQVHRWGNALSGDYNESKMAKTVKDLRQAGFTVEIDPSVSPPTPDKLLPPKGDDRFDVTLSLDRSTFSVNVDGYRSDEFLRRLDSQTKVEMKRDDKLAYLKEHPIAKKEIAAYKESLKLEGEKLENKADTYAMKELAHHLPADGYWHFVNKDKKTIPIGFVYHYALDFNDYNIKIIDNRPLYVDERSPIIPSVIDPVTGERFELRDYQQDAVESAIDKKSGIIAAATGSGKTEIGAYIVAGQGLDTVWFAHRGELIRQAEERMERRLGIDVGAYGGGKKEIINTEGMDVNVMTVQSASRIMRVPRHKHQTLVNDKKAAIKRLDNQISKTTDSHKKLQLESKKEIKIRELTEAKMELEVYDYLQSATVQVFDESHHMTALQFGDIARSTPQARYRYGLSATPYGNTSTDQKRIEALMGDKVASITATKLINEGYLARPNILLVDIPNTLDFPIRIYDSKGKYKKTVYSENDMKWQDMNKAAVVKNEMFNDYVVDFTLESRKAGLNTLILVNEVEHGNLIQQKLSDRELPVDFLNARDNDQTETSAMLNRFKAGKRDTMVATIGTVGEGVDMPALDTIVLAHGGKSLVQTIQRVGRAMRIPYGSDKRECVVIDFDRKEKYIGSGTENNHVEKRKEIYSLEPAFDVKVISVNQVDDEINRIARLNKAKIRTTMPVYAELDLEEAEEFQSRAQKRDVREIRKSAERLERIGTLEKTRKGKRLFVSTEAKRVTKRHSNISPVYAQQIMNIYNARGLDSQTIDWDRIDGSLEPAEAVKAAGI